MDLIKFQNRYKGWTLALIAISEIWISVLWCNTEWTLIHKLIWTIVPVIILTVRMIIGFRRKIFRTPPANIINKIISSNVGNMILAVCIGLFFLIQLTWLMDASFSLIFNYNHEDECQNWTALAMTIICIVASLCIYPYAELPDFSLNGRSQIYSCISFNTKPNKGAGYGFDYGNADLLFKPLFSKVTPVDDEPAHILTRINKFHIILSESFDFTVKMIDINDFEKNIPDLQKRLEKKGIADIISGDKIDEGKFNIFLHLILEYMIDKHVESSSEKEELLRQEQSLVISWRSNAGKGPRYTANYNDFKDTFEELQNCLSESETPGNTHETLLYISPGTAISAGVFSAMSLKGNRLILYMHQGSKATAEGKGIINNDKTLKAINPNTQAVNEYIKGMEED